MSEQGGTTPAGGQARRSFLGYAAMAAGLLTSFGTAVAFAARYIYPRRALRRVRQVFLAPVSDIPPGQSRIYVLPGGGTALVTNTGSEVVALSNVCPHLGCKVHWEEAARHFFCPCHNGTFDPSGKATGGPPFEAGQSLPRYPLRIEDGLLYIEVPFERLDVTGKV